MWVLLWLALAADLPRVSLVVYPRIVREGQSLHLECRVPRHPDNRWLLMGIVEASSSLIQLEGAEARVIHTRTLEAPCLGETATVFCLLEEALGRVHRATAPVTVLCAG